MYGQKLKSFHTGGRNKGSRPMPDWMNALPKPPHYFDINQWLNVTWDAPSLSLRDKLSYADTADVYADVFGQKNLKVLVFEELVRDPKIFITQLCDFMEIDPVEGLKLIQGKRANESVTVEYIDRIKALESSPFQNLRFRMSSPRQRGKILNHKKLSGDRIDPQISDEWLAKIHAVGIEQNRRLIDKWEAPLEEYGYLV
jgi:hypothetical protein